MVASLALGIEVVRYREGKTNNAHVEGAGTKPCGWDAYSRDSVDLNTRSLRNGTHGLGVEVVRYGGG